MAGRRRVILESSLRGKSYDEQAASLSPSTGSSDVLAATTGDALAHESGRTGHGDATYALLELQKQHPDASMDELMEMAATDGATGQVTPGSGQNPTLSSRGGAQPAKGGSKVGAYVGNETYANLNDLRYTVADAEAMSAAFGARGYEGGVSTDLTSGELLSKYMGTVAGLGPGDEALLYFAGHGADGDLLGVDSDGKGKGRLRGDALRALVDEATTYGYHLKIILDACETGLLTETMDGDRADQALARSGNETVVRGLIQLHADMAARTPATGSTPDAPSRGGERGLDLDVDYELEQRTEESSEERSRLMGSWQARFEELTGGDTCFAEARAAGQALLFEDLCEALADLVLRHAEQRASH